VCAEQPNVEWYNIEHVPDTNEVVGVLIHFVGCDIEHYTTPADAMAALNEHDDYD
jgi:hypothetical protein